MAAAPSSEPSDAGSRLARALAPWTARTGSGSRRFAALASGGLLALGLATGDPRWLRAAPAAVYLGLAGCFAASLREPGSLLESVARALVPEAPDFIRGYCRGLTALWAIGFAASAAAIATLAYASSPGAWLAFVARDLWLAMRAFAALEFLFRKTWFRYYFRGGPFDRLWSRLFPAQRTARGRRSQRAIDEYRARGR